MNYCRVFTEMAETFLETMINTPNQVDSSECMIIMNFYSDFLNEGAGTEPVVYIALLFCEH